MKRLMIGNEFNRCECAGRVLKKQKVDSRSAIHLLSGGGAIKVIDSGEQTKTKPPEECKSQAVFEPLLIFYLTVIAVTLNIGNQEKCFIAIFVKLLNGHVSTGTSRAVNIDFFVLWNFSETRTNLVKRY